MDVEAIYRGVVPEERRPIETSTLKLEVETSRALRYLDMLGTGSTQRDTSVSGVPQAITKEFLV